MRVLAPEPGSGRGSGEPESGQDPPVTRAGRSDYAGCATLTTCVSPGCSLPSRANFDSSLARLPLVIEGLFCLMHGK
jgi:hypothetical protein